MDTKEHQLTIELLAAPPAEVEAGGRLEARVRVSCAGGCDLGGARLEVTGADEAAHTLELGSSGDGGEGTDGAAAAVVELQAPATTGDAAWVITFPEQEIDGVLHRDAAMTVSTVVVPHDTSIAIWDVPSPLKGERFTVRVGIKCSRLCRLGGQLVEVLDEAGTKVGEGMLGGEPRAGTTGLYEGAVGLTAPMHAGIHARSVRFTASSLSLPHRDASGHFTFRALELPEHTVTVKVVPKGIEAPLKNVEVRVGAYRAETDADGLARVGVPKGTYQLRARRLDIEPVSKELEVSGDVAIEVDVGPRIVIDEDAERYG